MRYSIGRRRVIDPTLVVLEIKFEENNDSTDKVSSFFSGVCAFRFPELIERAARSDGFGTEVLHYRPYAIMDEEDKSYLPGICEGQLQLKNDVFGDTVVDEKWFLQLLFDFATDILDAHLHDEKVHNEYSGYLQRQTEPGYWAREEFLQFNPTWTIAMEEGLRKLKRRIQ
ncbi:MAG TPA: hypothetical protein VHM26_05840 [Chitinophagaceae bacterium]|nr:hypothetical protein [Chitinophagaceae bacterium]